MTFAWLAFSAYMLITIWLALRGMKKTTSFASFALGKGDMGPLLVGLTLSASIASTATFVINPGFVYQHGLSAFLHFAVASPLGVILALIIFSRGFRKYGKKSSALTLPQWIKERYKSPAMGAYFAVLNLLLSITFVVLIVKGSALVMQHTLGIGYLPSLFIIVGFVFSYIFLGGTYAHAYTNAFQGFIMIGVALLLVASGYEYFGGGLSDMMNRLAAIDANLVKPMNPASPLFSNVWEVLICSFIISMGLVCQPHILMKALYLRSDSDVNRYLTVGTIVNLIFAMILTVGFFARLRFGEPISQDAVMAVYISKSFGPILGVLISVALLAAGMSTLDGILVGASTIAANDLFLEYAGRHSLKGASVEEKQQWALKVSRYVLVAMGVISLVVALNPPRLVGIFAQVGIYGLTAASLVPIAAGIFLREISSRVVFAAAIVGPLVHFGFYFYQVHLTSQVFNPAVSASIGIGCSVVVLVAGNWLPQLAGGKAPQRARALRG